MKAAAVRLLLAGALLVGFADGADAQQREILEIASGDDLHRFRVELAVTPPERQRGLMERPYLPPDEGMLFLFDPPQPVAMWMKNTWIPLDMLFIDDAGEIRFIAAERVPFSLDITSFRGATRAVLEIAGGRAEELGIRVGDKVGHPRLFPPEP